MIRGPTDRRSARRTRRDGDARSGRGLRDGGARLRRRAGAVRDDLSVPSPCEGWTAQDVVDHVMGGTSYYTDAWGGQVPDVADDADLPTRYTAPCRGARRTPAASRACSTRWCRHRSAAASCPAAMMLGIYTADTLIHTWDLARAIGIDVQLDQDLLQRTWDGLIPIEAALRRPGRVRARRRHRRQRADAGPGDGLVRPSALSADGQRGAQLP